MKYNILYIESYSEISGGQIYLLRLLDGLDKERFTPFVVMPGSGSLSKTLKEKNICFEIISMSNIRQLNPFKFIRNIFDLVKGIINITRIIKDKKIDLVCINTDSSLFYGGISAKLAKVPAIWYAHYVWRKLTGKIVDAAAGLLVKKVVVASDVVAGPFKKRRNFVEKIYHGIDQDKFNVDNVDKSYFRKKMGFSQSDIILGCIGQISPLKGQDVFIRASVGIRKEFPGAKFVIIGNSKFSPRDKHKNKLTQLISRIKADGIYFLDFQDDLASVMASLDIVVVPSLFQDPSPLVCLEAMATGIPVIASNIGGIPELLQNGRGGVLFNPGDAEALRKAAVELLNNPRRKEEIIAQARKIINENFRLDNYYKNTKNLYLRILEKGSF